MRTTVTANHEREATVSHYLDEGEEWEDFGAAQPRRGFTHVESAGPWCTICTRPLRSLGRTRSQRRRIELQRGV